MQAVEIITTALATGAAAGLSKHAEQAITEAYNSFKRLLQSKFSGIELTTLERMPASTIQKSAVAEALRAEQADADPQIVKEAQRLLQLIEERDPDSVFAVGLTIEKLRAAGHINLRDITVAEGAVLLSNFDAGSDINIEGLTIDRSYHDIQIRLPGDPDTDAPPPRK